MKTNDSKNSSRRSLRRAIELANAGVIKAEQIEEIEEVCQNFSMAITPEMLDLIEADNPDDPIAKQFVPSRAEQLISDNELLDPIGDDNHAPVEGIIHRYPDRVLLKPLHVCAVYCRFCFRREKVGPGKEMLSPQELEQALDYIKTHSEIWEVILSGGDPLILPESRLAYIIDALDSINHVEVIRIHTRVPVVSPQRITETLLKVLKVDTPVYIVIHCNHPKELTDAAKAACSALVDRGIPLLSQTVLLKGINDDPETMTQLMRSLVRSRIKPYYLHHGDLAKGTGHFRTTFSEGQNLMRAIRGNLSGICQPTYVIDIPNGYGKVPLTPNYLTPNENDDGYLIEDYLGNQHFYKDNYFES